MAVLKPLPPLPDSSGFESVDDPSEHTIGDLKDQEETMDVDDCPSEEKEASHGTETEAKSLETGATSTSPASRPQTNSSGFSGFIPKSLFSPVSKLNDSTGKKKPPTPNQASYASMAGNGTRVQDSFAGAFNGLAPPKNDENSSPPSDTDLLSRIKGMHRLLELYSEQGSGGLVDKVIISQDSLRELIESLCPGAYASLTKINFTSLDRFLLKPVGVYGSKSAIVRLFKHLGVVDRQTSKALLAETDASRSTPNLRSGIYLLRLPADDFSNLCHAYVVYWPEDSTWNDNAISAVERNRITFMRYLTKLSDQVIALISKEHAEALVWDDASIDEEPSKAVDNSDDDENRLFTFEVQNTKEENEGVTLHTGFKIALPAGRRTYFNTLPADMDAKISQPSLVRGDTRQGLLIPQYVPARMVPTSRRETLHLMAIRSQIMDITQSFVLSDHVSPDQVQLLLRMGLNERYPTLYDNWCASETRRKIAADEEAENNKKAETSRLEAKFKPLKNAVVDLITSRVIDIYPIFASNLRPVSDEGDDAEIRQGYFHALSAPRSDIRDIFEENFRKMRFEQIRALDFQDKKKHFILAGEIISHRNLSSSKKDAIDLAIVSGKAQDALVALLAETKDKQRPGLVSGVWTMMVDKVWSDSPLPTATYARAIREAGQQQDRNFLANIHNQGYSVHLSKSVDVINGLAISWLLEKISECATMITHKIIARKITNWTTAYNSARQTVDQRELSHGLMKLKDDINLEASKYSANRTITLHHVGNVVDGAWNADRYSIHTILNVEEPAHMRFVLRSISLTESDKQSLASDTSFLPHPVVRNESIVFRTPKTSVIRHIELFSNGKCLLVVDDLPDNNTKIYLEDDNCLDQAIQETRQKKSLNHDKAGADFLLAVSETKRLVAVLSRKDFRLRIFVITEDFISIHARGSEIDLKPWLADGEVQLAQMCFISGSDELLVVEKSGMARIFSLMTEQFKPASLHLAEIPKAIFSTPDGSCLITVNEESENSPSLKAYHWSSFGTIEPIALNLPTAQWEQGVLTSLGSRSNIYLATVDFNAEMIRSVRLKITSRVNEYMFREQPRDAVPSGKVSHHNSLLNCHADVWTRYPVIAAIPRTSPGSSLAVRSICYISHTSLTRFRPHFQQLIRSFERRTRKPTSGILDQIVVSAKSFEDFTSSENFSSCTSYPAGKWLVELVCLIPIHIAITSGNRFVPLKDGVISNEFERSLLGAGVTQISNSLSIGWYESIFQSYLATMPVKVVSSMGEQSVGKSYALNHFVDTSFAGSAMRCTEGVWLSVTPNSNELVVALDFEGIHSIERSAQEDMLLVLFNTALSNLVLFRNNFAISRDIAGLFTSFQSSSSLLDPASNSRLFQSTLAIIIKDVVDSDSRGIVKEFSLKFQKIVQDEQEGNFITKLYRGTLLILPWPVIQSPNFYSLMSVLKRRLDAQPSTHGNASMFLQTLKTLMAKLKASDWGALDQNLASHRAQILQTLLPTALMFGVAEIGTDDGHLRDLDTSEMIPHNDSDSIFFLESLSSDPFSERAHLLTNLRHSWTSRAREDTEDSDWLAGLASHMQALTRARIAHIRNWMEQNISRFPSDHPDIQSLRRKFDQLSGELITGTKLCGMKCGSCDLLCVEGRQHEGDHNCTTSHKCVRLCEFDGKVCGHKAGHNGRHVCDVTTHLCGELCHLEGKNGCERACVQPIDHTDVLHLCSARTHACGEPCHLSQTMQGDGQILCKSTCAIDCRDAHDRHVCENRLTCPMKCQLCQRLCSVTDHFHALANGAIHLCGQEHLCEQFCTSQGICHIETAPRSVESTFVGRNEQFQFTKYSQVAHRLRCIISIPPNKLKHGDSHTHSSNDKAFHFCEAQCPFCKYFCTLPLGHPREHETSHGSMEETTWAFDGNDSTVREIQGRRFSSGDSGAPMLCSIVCGQLGRHVHVDFCRAPSVKTCRDTQLEHIHTPMLPKIKSPKDWITHALYWGRTGFKDPYSRDEQADFARCDAFCSGDEHKATESTPAQPSYCVLPIFHAPATVSPGATGYISRDGHAFRCRNPVVQQAAFHVVFVLDRSGSMGSIDRRPLANTPVSALISRRCDNRYGAVLSALHSFWLARETAAVQSGGIRRDAYSIVLLGGRAETPITHDFSSTAAQLLNPLLSVAVNQGTNFVAAVSEARRVVEINWSSERVPVVIFLSDGEQALPQTEMYDLCRRCVALGHPLSFHSVSFGRTDDKSTSVLRRMADIAREVHASAPRVRGINNNAVPCGFTNAIDTIQLAQTFLGIAESMRQARGSLIRS